MADKMPDLHAVFNQALERESDEERSSYLDEACQGDPQVRGRVEALLRAHSDAGNFLGGRSPAVAPIIDQPPAEQPGAMIGPYKLIEEIGEGGMGSVFMAQQKEPVRRKVALKVIKPGMDSKQVVSRFEAERQALAMMDHPNIARVFDGGSTESGRPYFVMELVNGMPVTDYCDRYRVTIDQRLELFIQVCQAVQHAHQKGIIHRDLKPSNILVTHLDGRAVPKVIDFGVAKAISGQLTDQTSVTHFAQMIGTPLYMSPEQADLSSQDIDTRSDVYSLGVLLYELLTGATPFDRQRLKEASPDEFRRIIQEEEPPRPSTRLSTLEAALDTVAEKHQTDPRTLSRRLSGELDWIVMRALEKDRNRRYESASAFGADIKRYLNDEPVAACPPSLSYQFRKFARRNRVALTTSAVVAVAVLLGTGASVWQAHRATNEAHRATNEARRATLAEELAGRRLEQVDEQRRLAEDNYNEAESQRRRAEANVQLALDTLDQVCLPLAEMAFAEKIELDERDRQILEKTLPFYETLAAQQADDPQTQYARARAYLRVGNIYRTLRVHPDEKDEKAEKALLQAIALFEELTAQSSDKPQYHRDLAISYRDLGELLHVRQPEEAERAYRRSIALYENVVDDLPWYERHELASVQFALGERLLSPWGRPEEAVQALRESLATAEELLEEYPDSHTHQARVAGPLLKLGDAHHAAGQTQQAEEFLRKAIDHCEHWGAEFPDLPDYPLDIYLGAALTKLANLLERLDRLEEAEKAYFRARDVLENVVRRWPGPTWYRNELGNVALPALARFLESRQRFDEAETAWRRAIALAEQLAVEMPHGGHPWAANNHRLDLLKLLMKLGRDEEAGKVISAARPAPGTAEEYVQRAKLYETVHQYDKAWADYEKVVELDPTFAHRQCLGAMLYRAGRLDEAMEILTSIADSEQPEAVSPAYGWYFLAMTQHELGNQVEARKWLDKAVDHTEKALDENRHDYEPVPWNRKLTLELLRAEAEALLNGADTDESPESRSEDVLEEFSSSYAEGVVSHSPG